MNFEIKNRSLVYDGFLKIELLDIQHDLFDGGKKNIKREFVNGGHAVFLFIIDKNIRKGLYVNQFRVGACDKSDAWTLELIAGLVDKGEEPVFSTIRECKEETGIELKINELNHIVTSQASIGTSNKIFHIYYAESDLSNIDEKKVYGTDEDEDIRLKLLDFEDIKQRSESGSLDTLQEFAATQFLIRKGIID